MGLVDHPLRVATVEYLLTHGRASPSEIADALDVKLPNLSYHIRQLIGAGVLKRAGTRQVRGAIEHFYKIDTEARGFREFRDKVEATARATGLAPVVLTPRELAMVEYALQCAPLGREGEFEGAPFTRADEGDFNGLAARIGAASINGSKED